MANIRPSFEINAQFGHKDTIGVLLKYLIKFTNINWCGEGNICSLLVSTGGLDLEFP